MSEKLWETLHGIGGRKIVKVKGKAKCPCCDDDEVDVVGDFKMLEDGKVVIKNYDNLVEMLKMVNKGKFLVLRYSPENESDGKIKIESVACFGYEKKGDKIITLTDKEKEETVDNWGCWV